MAPDRDAILKALECVIDPELKRPVTDLDMVRDVVVSPDGAVEVVIALTVAGCPLRSSFQDQVAEHVGGVPGVASVALHFDVMTPEEKAALAIAAPRRSARARDPARPGNTRRRGRVGQGRRRQVDTGGEPGGGTRRARRARRRARRGRLRLLDPARPRRDATARRRRLAHRPAGSRRPQGDVDRALRRGQRPDHVARPDAPQGARAVPLGCPLGGARHPRRRHAARDRGRRDLDRSASPARGGDRRDDAAARRAAGRRARGRDGAEDGNARCSASSRTCRGSSGPARSSSARVEARRSRRRSMRRCSRGSLSTRPFARPRTRDADRSLEAAPDAEGVSRRDPRALAGERCRSRRAGAIRKALTVL